MRAIDNKNDHGNLRKRKYLRGAQAYLTGTHLFERERGGEMTGETTVMTGREAKALNLDMQQDFCYAVRRARETGVENKERLERWVCKEQNVEDNAQSAGTDASEKNPWKHNQLHPWQQLTRHDLFAFRQMTGRRGSNVNIVVATLKTKNAPVVAQFLSERRADSRSRH